jgi:hypothetical protein
MAKKVNIDEIDERLIVAAVRKEQIKQEIVPPPLVPLPAVAVSETVPVAVAVPPEEIKEIKEIKEIEDTDSLVSPPEPQKEKRKSQDYETLFIKETDLPPARFGKSVYIRKEYHDKISQIISVIGGNEVSLFGYIDNVIAHHLENYREEITRSFKKKIIFK